jgi:isomerase DpgB
MDTNALLENPKSYAASADQPADVPRPLIELTLTMGRALCKDMVDDILQLCDQAEDAGANAIVRINLDARSVESDASNASDSTLNVTLVNRWERALRRLERLAAVTVVVAAADIGGLGLAVLLCADHRIIADTLSLRLSHPGQPLLPGMVLHRLSNQLGVPLARRMAVFDRRISAQDAFEHGLVDEISPNPNAAAINVIRELQRQDLTELALRRRLILEASAVSYEDALGAHLAACDRVLRHASGHDRPQLQPHSV